MFNPSHLQNEGEKISSYDYLNRCNKSIFNITILVYGKKKNLNKLGREGGLSIWQIIYTEKSYSKHNFFVMKYLIP